MGSLKVGRGGGGGGGNWAEELLCDLWGWEGSSFLIAVVVGGFECADACR